MREQEIIISPYSPEWPAIFEQLKDVYESTLGSLITAVHHVGSTSVPGLASKPFLDIDLVIDDRDKLEEIKKRLSTLGYIYCGDLGIKDREAFNRISDKTPQGNTSRAWMDHHLYVCFQNSTALKNHLLLRDFFRHHVEAAEAYGALKRKLSQQYQHTRESYTTGKTSFIIALLKEAGLSDEELQEIRDQNSSS